MSFSDRLEKALDRIGITQTELAAGKRKIKTWTSPSGYGKVAFRDGGKPRNAIIEGKMPQAVDAVLDAIDLADAPELFDLVERKVNVTGVLTCRERLAELAAGGDERATAWIERLPIVLRTDTPAATVTIETGVK